MFYVNIVMRNTLQMKKCLMKVIHSGHRSVELESIPDFPAELRLLFENRDGKSRAFFARIRNYNSSFSFASFNANLVNFPIIGRAPYYFKIQGQVYYEIIWSTFYGWSSRGC